VTIGGNRDPGTIEGFGDEWHRFDQSTLDAGELERLFHRFFRVFPWHDVAPDAVGFDMGCGSGRWAKLVAPRVGRLVCIDASAQALDVCRRNLAGFQNCEVRLGSFENIPVPDGSMDFGYCLGVLHHIPDAQGGLAACVRKLRPGAPFLVYIYYALENRPAWYRAIWRVSDEMRRAVTRLPYGWRNRVTDGLAALLYYPLARFARLVEALGLPSASLPLSAYREASFYTMRTDARDRFGTPLEKRFSRHEIAAIMRAAGLDRIVFSEEIPFWCAVGYRAK
jgi:SAM-dependent methyltransferase